MLGSSDGSFGLVMRLHDGNNADADADGAWCVAVPAVAC